MTAPNRVAIRERFAALLHLGRQQGFLTYSQVNAQLAEKIDPALLDDLLNLFEDEALELVNAPIVDENSWLTCSDPASMLEFVRGKASGRKLRLLAVARCRRFLALFQDARSRRAIETAERLADGMVTEGERRQAKEDANAALTELQEQNTISTSNEFRYLGAPERTASDILDLESSAVAVCGLEVLSLLDFMGNAEARAFLATHDKDEIALLYELFGNPFRPNSPPDFWPATVVQLAEAVYDGRECAFALHDALLETDRVELAEHFRQEKAHPKGCWALDLILSKK